MRVVVTDNNERVQMSNEVASLAQTQCCTGRGQAQCILCIDASYSRSSGRDIDNSRSAQALSSDGQIKPEEEPNLFTILCHTTVKDADQRLRLFIGMEVMVTENINLASEEYYQPGTDCSGGGRAGRRKIHGNLKNMTTGK
jgi:hypothetical protein